MYMRDVRKELGEMLHQLSQQCEALRDLEGRHRRKCGANNDIEQPLQNPKKLFGVCNEFALLLIPCEPVSRH